MKGLIIKDLLSTKNNLTILGVILIIDIIMALNGDNSLTFLPPFMSVMMGLSTFSYDEYNKWDAYAITLPKGRENVVKAKYIMSLLLVLSTSLLVFILSCLMSFISKGSLNIGENLGLMFGSIIGTLLVVALMYPLIFKYGIEKGRLIIFVLVFGIAIGGGFLLNFFDLSSVGTFLNNFGNYLIYFFIVFIILIIGASYFISRKIYLKKDF